MSKTHKRRASRQSRQSRQSGQSKTTKKQRRSFSMKGGAVNKIPGIPAVFEDFVANWKLNYIGGHGRFNGDVFKVPENTYILNFATAGRSCLKSAYDVEDRVFEKPPASALSASTFKKSILTTIHKELLSGDFLKEITDLESEPIEFIYNPEPNDITKPNSRLKALYHPSGIYRHDDVEGRSISFYEPGDIMSDIDIKMYEDHGPHFLMGLYDVPIQYDIRQKIFNTNKRSGFIDRDLSIEEFRGGFIMGVGIPSTLDQDNNDLILNAKNLFKHNLTTPAIAPTAAGGAGAAPPSAAVGGAGGTDIIDKTRTTYALSDIILNVDGITNLSKISTGMKRIIFVKACRTAPGINPAIMHRVRRLSVSARQVPRVYTKDGAPLIKSRMRFGVIKQFILNFIYRKNKGMLPLPLPLEIHNAELSLIAIVDKLNANKPVRMDDLLSNLQTLYSYAGILLPELVTVLGWNLHIDQFPAGAVAAAAAAADAADAAAAAGAVGSGGVSPSPGGGAVSGGAGAGSGP